LSCLTEAMTHYNAIFIGSSPLFLMCHHTLSKTQSSLLLEASGKLGGAWYYGDLWDARNIEMGCHILKNIPKGYDLMKKHGIPLEQMQTQPALLITAIKGESFLNTAKNAFLYSRKIFTSNKLHSKYSVQKLENIVKRKTLVPYHYLRRGCFDLLESLKPDPQTVFKNKPVRSISVAGDVATLLLDDGTQLTADHVYLPRNFKINAIVLNKEAQDLRYTAFISEHYLLKYPKNSVRFTFFECLGDDLVNLVSNVGLYTETQFDIIAIAVKKPAAKQENNLSVSAFSGLPGEAEKQDVANQIHGKLLKFGVLRPGCKLIDFHYEPYILNSRSRQENDALAKKSNGVLIFMDTTDLVESISTNRILNDA
jgi:hypothetical protein